jgi:hypothetical protein
VVRVGREVPERVEVERVDRVARAAACEDEAKNDSFGSRYRSTTRIVAVSTTASE